MPEKNQVKNRFVPTSEDYQSIEHHEHVLKCPGMYIGSVNPINRVVHVYDRKEEQIVSKHISTPEGVERLFLEIISNAGDNCTRSRKAGVDPEYISVQMDGSKITITNYGLPIPVENHPKEKIPTPRVIFGTLLSGSNYQGSREGAGINGLGAKLVNIFSKIFILIVGDAFRKKKYRCVWSNNMYTINEESITEYPEGKSFVQVEYHMDFERFGYDQFNLEEKKENKNSYFYRSEDISLFMKHCIDFSFNAKIPVVFNEIELNYSSILKYSKLFLQKCQKNNKICKECDKCQNRPYFLYYEWPDETEVKKIKSGEEIGTAYLDPQAIEDAESWGLQVQENYLTVPNLEVCCFDTPDEGFSTSFANGMITRDGGKHVDAAVRAVTVEIKSLITEMSKTKSKPRITIKNIKPHISIVVSTRVINPEYIGNSKSRLATNIPKITLPKKIVKNFIDWDIIGRINADLTARLFKKQSGNSKRKRDLLLKKGLDANEAGGVNSNKCTLLITEGDSAMQYGLNLFEFIPDAREFFGLYPGKGKPINARNQHTDKILLNQELNRLCKMIGLVIGMDYRQDENFQTLRYHRIYILGDADPDGIHINGLYINNFDVLFPGLLERGVIGFMRTPIIRVFKGKQSKKFFTQRSFEKWYSETKDSNKWKTKYYKGLASSLKKDISDDAKNIRWVNFEKDPHAEGWMQMVFNKSKKFANKRKRWIRKWKPQNDLENLDVLPVSTFISDVTLDYAITNIERSLPGQDGLKTSQRKILWTAMKGVRNWNFWRKTGQNTERKVSIFGAAVSEFTHYPHGEKSLFGAIVKMSQDFVGANNLPYLEPMGAFGTRVFGGKKASAPRYIFTRPMWWTKHVFLKEDLNLLKLVEKDGAIMEPEVLLPIIPMHLINGVCGIGTGFSTFMPAHNPLDIIDWLLAYLDEKETPELVPWYRGFKGSIWLVDKRSDEVKEVRGGKIVDIKELTQTDLISEKTQEEQEKEERERKLKLLTDNKEESSESDLGTDCDLSGKEIENKWKEDEKEARKGRYTMITEGNYEWSKKSIIINELPVCLWTYDYEKILMQWRADKLIKGYKSKSAAETLHFEIYGSNIDASFQSLRLRKSYGMGNMVLLKNRRPVKYKDTDDIMTNFYNFRIEYYHLRKTYLIKALQEKIVDIENKVKLISLIALDKKIDLLSASESEIENFLQENKIPSEYLDKLNLRSQTPYRVKKLQDEFEKSKKEMEEIKNVDSKDMWKDDLLTFRKEYCKYYKIIE